MRRFLLIPLILLLVACRHNAPTSVIPVIPVMPIAKVQQTRPVPSFNQILAQGRINIHLHTGAAKPLVQLRGALVDLSQVLVHVEHSMLVISLGSGYPRCGEVTVDIYTRSLNSLRYTGLGQITGTNIHSSLLDLFITNPGQTILRGSMNIGVLEVNGGGYVEISDVNSRNLHVRLKGNPRVKLTGIERLATLDVAGNGSLSMYWVNSDGLIVRAGDHAFIQLAGIVNKLDVCLQDFARFNGRYLRAKRAFIKTFGHSVAEISSVDRQHTLASDSSDIYFYNIPVMRTDFMAFDGSVLDMRDLGDPYAQEYDRYNKQMPF